jgi:hypothetical protein
MRSPKAPAEDPAAKAARERDRRLSDLARLDTVVDQADDLTDDLRKVYGLRRLGRPGATAVPGRQPVAAAMPKGPTPAPGTPGGLVFKPNQLAPGFLGGLKIPVLPPQPGQPGGKVFAPAQAAPGFLGGLRKPMPTGKTDRYHTNGKWVGNKNK